jgi:hypothetical protein
MVPELSLSIVWGPSRYAGLLNIVIIALAIPFGIFSFMAPLPAGNTCINSNPRVPARHALPIMSNFNYPVARSDLVWDAHLLTTCCEECSIFGTVALSPI